MSMKAIFLYFLQDVHPSLHPHRRNHPIRHSHSRHPSFLPSFLPSFRLTATSLTHYSSSRLSLLLFSPPSSLYEVTALGFDNASNSILAAQRHAPFLFQVAKDGSIGCNVSSPIVTPHGLYINPATQEVWVTDVGDFTVRRGKLTDNGCRFVQTAQYGTPGTSGGSLSPLQFDTVADVAQPPDGFVAFIADGDGGFNNRILSLDVATGKPVWNVGGNGTSPGDFSSPHSIAYHILQNLVWVADRGNQRLQVFTAANGVEVGSWDCFNGTDAPWGIRIDEDRQVAIVPDGGTGSVYIFDLSGVTKGDLGACKLVQTLRGVSALTSKPHEMTIDRSTGDVYVALVGAPTGILRLTPSM